jgi:hypothetical protein
MLVLALEFSRIRAARLDRAGVNCPLARGSQRGERWPDSHVAKERQAAPSKRKSEVRTCTIGHEASRRAAAVKLPAAWSVLTVWCEPISQCSTG